MLTDLTSSCVHCGGPLFGARTRFCCVGCEMVHGLLHSEDLERFYDLRGARGQPVTAGRSAREDRSWVEPLARAVTGASGIARVDLDVQGLHCAGCIWLLDALLRRAEGGESAVVNPALGRITLYVRPTFDLPAYADTVGRFGYLLGPPLKDVRAESDGLLLRMGVCIAIAMITMILSISVYAGLTAGPLYHTFQRLTFALTCVSMFVGGTVFLRSAWEAARRGMLHLDLPIALGVVLAFVGSAVSYFTRAGEAYFLDTVNVFIALMLVGRWVQLRVLERNRRQVLASDGAEGLRAKRLEGGRPVTVGCADIEVGDRMLVAPGELVPVDAALEGSEPTRISLDWITGESAPVDVAPGGSVPAGAFLAATHAVTLRATGTFARGALLELLRAPRPREADAFLRTRGWQRFARFYVVAVLAAAAAGFAGWAILAHDAGRALDVATAVLIVTCPCAFGLATPLAYEMVLAGLRREGLYVRSGSFLDRAQQVKRVVFDKTGTLTTGELALADADPLRVLDTAARGALADMVFRSTHPKSVALQKALEGARPVLDPTADVREVPGHGLELTRDGASYRLGHGAWAAGIAGDLVLARDGQPLAAFATTEELRGDARAEVARLGDDGLDVYILSGDAQARVDAVAASVGIAPEHAVGEARPEAKEAWVAARDREDTLMIGDGINDSLVVEKTFCSGTPAIDRPFMAARSDFYFVTPGLGPVTRALRAARALGKVTRRNLGIAVGYNVLAVGLAWAGLMSPLVCAILMPVSSLTTILHTTRALSGRRASWKS